MVEQPLGRLELGPDIGSAARPEGPLALFAAGSDHQGELVDRRRTMPRFPDEPCVVAVGDLVPADRKGVEADAVHRPLVFRTVVRPHLELSRGDGDEIGQQVVGVGHGREGASG